MKLTLVAVAFILMIASYFWGYVLLLMNDKPIIAYVYTFTSTYNF